eukprot:g27882.t1
MPMPEKPEGVDEGIVKGLYKFSDAKPAQHKVRLIGSGAIMKQALDAVELLAEYGVGAEIWSATSYSELQRDAVASERADRLGAQGQSWVEQCLSEDLVTVAVSDNMTAYPMLIAPYVTGKYIVLGADGFGRSDTREALRRFFEIDKEHVAVAALYGLAKQGKISMDVADQAREKFGISAEKKDGANHQKCSVSFKALLLQLLFASDSALKDGAWKGHLHGGDQLSTREATSVTLDSDMEQVFKRCICMGSCVA